MIQFMAVQADANMGQQCSDLDVFRWPMLLEVHTLLIEDQVERFCLYICLCRALVSMDES